MKFFIVSGEASGDLHASNLVKELLKKDDRLKFQGWGGEKMEDAGVKILKHYKELAFMGFTEVILNLKTILSNLESCKRQILEFRPAALILVDYPGFNLRLAAFAKKHGIKVIYYISPQVWAWKENRVNTIRRFVDHMMVILPFEKEFFRKHEIAVDFVGHPLLDRMEINTSGNRKNIIAMIPGSRTQEIRSMLPVMLAASKDFPDLECVVTGAPSVPAEFYAPFLKDYPKARLVHGQTETIMKEALMGCVTSGTATLEAALAGLPQVVCYKGGALSYWIARSLVKIKYISLVNLILDKEVVTELIQDKFNPVSLVHELKALQTDSRAVDLAFQYRELKSKLGGPGASGRAADSILRFLGK